MYAPDAAAENPYPPHISASLHATGEKDAAPHKKAA